MLENFNEVLLRFTGFAIRFVTNVFNLRDQNISGIGNGSHNLPEWIYAPGCSSAYGTTVDLRRRFHRQILHRVWHRKQQGRFCNSQGSCFRKLQLTQTQYSTKKLRWTVNSLVVNTKSYTCLIIWSVLSKTLKLFVIIPLIKPPHRPIYFVLNVVSDVKTNIKLSGNEMILES